MSDKKRILVVDDEIAVAMMLVSLLTRAGHDVEAALDAQKALQRLQNESFDLITLDVGMPGTSGFALYERIRQIPCQQNTPVVFVSGRQSAEDRQKAFALGAVDYIEKPFSPRDFLSRILHLRIGKNVMQSHKTESEELETL